MSFLSAEYEQALRRYNEFGVSQEEIHKRALSLPNLQALSSRISTRKPRKILEMGVTLGDAAIIMAGAAPGDAIVHTVIRDTRIQEATIRLAEFDGVAHKIHWHHREHNQTKNGNRSGASVDASICKGFGPFDFIYIGQGISVDAIHADLAFAVQNLTPGGMIAVNYTLDLNRGQHVRRAIFELLKDRSDFVFFQNRTWQPMIDLGFLQHFVPGAKHYELDSTYDQDFYDRCLDMHSRVVPHIARVLFDLNKPKSVIDFGCGAGMWLKEFQKLGVQDLCGVDGSREAIEQHNRDLAENVSIFDLRKKFTPKKRYDLCLILDVIEHLEPEFEDILLDSCVASSDTIIFSSPPPGQGGDGHVNERPIAHWVEKFLDRGYVLYDDLRPHFEGRPEIPETTYQLNTYTVKRTFDPKEISTGAISRDALKQLLSSKEARIEGLFLQNLFMSRALEAVTHELAFIPRPPQSVEAFYEGLPLVRYVIPKSRIRLEDGSCYIFEFKTEAGKAFFRTAKFCGHVLFENATQLPGGNAEHSAIRTQGLGKNSFWLSQLYFSTSDNSDPRTNDKEYSFMIPAYLHELEERSGNGAVP